MFAILCAARSGEVMGATWDEIDLEAGVWTVPPDRMKIARPHRVPLSAPAVDILRGQLAARGKKPARVPRCASSSAAQRYGARHGHAQARRRRVHSARVQERVPRWAGDRTNFQRAVAEAPLAHAVGEETEQAYRRSDALEKRRELVDAWASFCFPTSAELVSIADRRKRS